jgi:hypothetical protein
MDFIIQRLKFKIRMPPQSRRGRAAAAAADAQSSSEETPEVEPRPKQSKTGPKRSDKTASALSAVALEELESLNH